METVVRRVTFRSFAAHIPGIRKKRPIKGRIERIEGRTLHGWAFDPSAPDRHLDIDIKIDDAVVASCTANLPRGDLARAGIGDGSHAFQVKIPDIALDGRTHTIGAFERQTGWALQNPIAEVKFDPLPASKKPSLRGNPSRPLSAFIATDEVDGPAVLAENPDRVDAVLNGRFTHWSAPFRQTLNERSIPLADGWFLEGKKPNPKVSAWLTEVITRDLLSGSEGTLSYGTALFGDLPGKYVRLSTRLDIQSLAAGSTKRLAFFARPASALQQHPALSGPPVSLIGSVSLVERKVGSSPDELPQDQRLCTLGKKLKVPPAGKFFEFDLGGDQLDSLQLQSATTAPNAQRLLLLVFEFNTFVDCVVSNVSLTTAPNGDAGDEALPHRIGLEDENITAQIPALRGVEHWRSPEALPVPVSQHGGRLATISTTAKWRWPSQPGRSLEVVICVHDAVEETLDCLDSVKRCTTVPHIVTVVNDGSNGSTRAQLRKYAQGAPWIRLIESETQMGYTKAANAGLSSATADWLVLLNSDTIVTPGWIDGFFEVLDARPDVSFIGPLSNAASWQSVPDVRDSASGWKINVLPEGMTIDEMAALVAELSPRQFPEVPLLNGFCTMMRRRAVEELGFLDEVNFPQGYGEENDLCLRARTAGHRLALADHVYVYHVKSASFGAQRRNQLSKRGTERLLAKHPNADMQKLQQEMAELGALAELRKSLRRRLSQISQPASSEVA